MNKELIKKWVKPVVSAIVGAAISFGVTYGVLSKQDAQDLYTSLSNINEKSALLIGALESKDVDNALAIAKEIAQVTKFVIDTSKEAISNIKQPETAAE